MELERIYLQPKSSPRLFDRPIQDLQNIIGAKLSFMDHVFGRCERLLKAVDGQRYYTPNIYRGNNDYVLLTPDNRVLGNYCFFVPEEPETMTFSMGAMGRIKAPFSLVVWVDQRTVEESDLRNVYDLELKVLDAIGTPGTLRNGSIDIRRVFHRAENVFAGFTLDEVDNQFMMSPFMGLRIEFELRIDEDCRL